MDERQGRPEKAEAVRRLRREGAAAPDELIEILYEYLSEHISTHFEKTIEGMDTLHNALRMRQEEHADIMKRLDELVERVREIETRIGAGKS